jgi:transcriptional regulator MraZ
VYFGEYERTVDYKGRLTVPSHLLVASEDTDWSKVMVLKAEPECLYVYDLETWKAVLDEAYRSMDDDESRLFMHRALSDAQLSDVDNLKRITISAPLLEHAHVEKRAIVVGMFNRLEVWNPEVWLSYLETLEEVPVPSISDLSRARIREVS